MISQGEKGDVLYVVDSGQLDCYKTFKKGEGPKHLKVYQPGESFGELSLLYNAPRAATIMARSECVLFSLDRECFNGIVKDAAAKKREQYDAFLSKVDLLSTMDSYERSKIADALKPINVGKGEYIVKEVIKDISDLFCKYVSLRVKLVTLSSSSLKVRLLLLKLLNLVTTLFVKLFIYLYIHSELGQPPEKVFEYGPGSYFGELALLKDIPRQANIISLVSLLLERHC